MMYQFIKTIRSRLLVYLTHSMALPLLKLVRKPEVFPYNISELNCFPAGTLGNDLAGFIDSKELELLPYYARHDMKHILLEYETTDHGEVCLQSFMLGNGHVSFPVIATVFYGMITMPEYWKRFYAAFIRGRYSIPIKNWSWFTIVHDNTVVLRKKINQK